LLDVGFQVSSVSLSQKSGARIASAGCAVGAAIRAYRSCDIFDDSDPFGTGGILVKFL